MLNTILETLRLKTSNDDQDTRRAHERHTDSSCIGIIDGVSYPIENWSKGGIAFIGDDRQFSLADLKDVTMRFKLADRVVDVLHKGHILRKRGDKFVLQFSPLTQNIERQFNHVINDYVTQEFASSQH